MITGKTLKDFPETLEEWDYELNGSLDPLNIPSQSNKKYYWKCKKGHPSYLCSAEKKTKRKHGCPVCSNHQIVAGINDFQTAHPELMDEWDWEKNNELDIFPDKISPVSDVKAWWKCKKCGNSWISSISNRVRLHSGCPYCSRKKAKKGFNDLQTTHPEIAKQWDYSKNGKYSPEDYVSGSFRKIWWLCDKGHSWLATIASRTNGHGCPYCSNNKILVGYNDLFTLCPDLKDEWDYDKNPGLNPYNYTRGSEQKIWWKCSKGHSWRARIAERGSGQGCPYCSNQKILEGYNDLFTTCPNLKDEWDFEKNTDISPYKIAAGSSKKAWWKCKKCGNSWSATIHSRSTGYGCPVCGTEKTTIGRLKTIASKNGLFQKFPELEKEWDYEKNKDTDISLLAASSNKFAWWLCDKGHSFRTRISSRTLHNVGCPYCHNQIVLKGINDLQTLNPLLAKEWDFEKNYPLTPSDVFSHSTKSVWWRCPVCGHSWKSKVNNRANARGCPNCSRAGTSLIEQAMFYYVKKCYVDALSRYKYEGVELDIYIPSKNVAIEYDSSFYHNSKSAVTREKKKDDFCSSVGIKLIRLREKPLEPTANAVNLICDCTKWDRIEKTISDLLEYLGCKIVFEISLKNDLPYIITSRRKLLKEKAFGKEFPQLLAEWDYEKNLPVIPDYFGKGSSAKVWWICKKGHSFQQRISNRCHGTGCPECFLERRQAGLHRKK